MFPVSTCKRPKEEYKVSNVQKEEQKIAMEHLSSRAPGHLHGNFRLRLKQGRLRVVFCWGSQCHWQTWCTLHSQVKTVTQQWKQFPSSERGSPALTSYYPQSNDGLSQGLQALSYQSGDGVSPRGLQSRDISNGDRVHLPLHPNDSQFVMVNLWENIQGISQVVMIYPNRTNI